MANRYRVAIIHGTFATPTRNWFPWLKNQVEALGHEVMTPAFPTPTRQSLDQWRRVFVDTVGPVNDKVILIGHSVGAGFICHLLEEALQPAHATFLVGGFLGALGLPDFDQVNETFVTDNFDWCRVRLHTGSLHLYNGDNDPYVPLQKAQDLARQIGVATQIIEGGGHLNEEAGYTTFPLLLDALTSQLTVSRAGELDRGFDASGG